MRLIIGVFFVNICGNRFGIKSFVAALKSSMTISTSMMLNVSLEVFLKLLS